MRSAAPRRASPTATLSGLPRMGRESRVRRQVDEIDERLADDRHHGPNVIVAAVTLMLVDAAGSTFARSTASRNRSPHPDGMPVNAVRGYLDMSATLITRRRPSRYVACLDLDWRPAFRVALVPSYKAHGWRRRATRTSLTAEPPDPGAARCAGGDRAGDGRRPGFEADDVIATLAARDRIRPRSSPVTGT